MNTNRWPPAPLGCCRLCPKFTCGDIAHGGIELLALLAAGINTLPFLGMFIK